MAVPEFIRWFAGGAHPYHDLFDCMHHDALWVAITVTFDLAVAAGYVVIAARWREDEKRLPGCPAKTALGQLKKIFIFCGLCGYLFIPIKMFWPAWRLYDIVMGGLVYYTWRYAAGSRGLQVIYSALDQNARLNDDLCASKADRALLEKRVESGSEELAAANEALRAEIAERKRAAEVLAAERNLLRTLIDALPDLVYAKDREGRYILNNKAHLQFLGRATPAELHGGTPFDVFPPELAERYHADDLLILEGGMPVVDGEEPSVDAKGNPRWICRTKVPFRDAEGKIAGLVGIGRDVTAQRNAQQSLRRNSEELEQRVLDRTLELAAANDSLRADIAMRQKAEGALRDSEERLRFLADAMPQIVWTATPSGEIDYYNARGEQCIGKTIDAASASGFDGVVHPADLPRCRELWELSVRNGEPYETEFRLRHAPENTYRWHLIRALPRRDHDGQIVQWVGTCTDLDDQKRAEVAMKEMHNNLEVRVLRRTAELAASNQKLEAEIAERRRAEAAIRGLNETLERRVAERSAAAEARSRDLAESESRFRQLAEAIDDVFWMSDPRDGRIIYISTAYERVWGLTTQSRYARPDSLLDVVHPHDRERVKAAMERQARGADTSEEYRIVRPDGTVRWIWDRGFPIADAEGKVYRVAGLAEDITDRKQAEADLQHAKECAEAANRAKSEFLANMSHEIRTPMTAIVGFADMLLESSPDAPDRGECVQVIRRNARHLLELINEVLDLSKIEAGQMTVERISCDVPQLMSDVMALMRPRAAEKGLRFDIEFAGPIPRRIETDPLRLRQVLVNLIGNAVKFTESGGISLRLSAEGTGGSDVLRVDVKDTGIGLTEQQIERLFRPFTQADESTTRRFGGSGLGLTISRRLARLLGGDIGIKSQPGEGSTFTLWINGGSSLNAEMLNELTEATLPQAAGQSDDERTEIHGRVLLAEDGRDNQRLLMMHLRAAGAEVVLAENGRIALERAMKQPFDLILMDMQMPEMDGYTATAELRKQGFNAPIIALTAHAMSEDRSRCLESGCSDYLTKPVEREVLLKTINQHLRGHGASVPSPAAPAPPAAPPTPAPATVSAAAGAERIRSTMADDSRMKQIVVEFIEGLPAEVRSMEEALKGDLQALRRTVHQLRGAGGGYGLDVITELATRAEDSIKAADDLDAIKKEVNALIEVIRRVDGYDESKVKSPSEEHCNDA